MIGLPERPEVCFLDLGDTLARAHPSWAAVYENVLHQFGLPVPEEDAFRTAWREAFLQESEGPFEASEEASYQRLKEVDGRIFARLGFPELPDEFFRAVERAFSARSAWFIFDDVVPALDALSAAGVRLALISNWSWAAPDLLHDLELARHFEAIVVSARVGYQKPSRQIFEHALELMRVAPRRAVHVGDSLHADVRGAHSAGMAAVLIARGLAPDVGPADRAERAGGEDVPVVRDLYELVELLGVGRAALANAG